MLTALRAFAGTWFAKVLFILLIASFGAWGIADMLRSMGTDTAVARVDGQTVEFTEAQDAARRELQRLVRITEGRLQPDARVRTAVAQQAVESLVNDRVLSREIGRMHVAVPDAAAREYVFGIPAFQGTDGRFSRIQFDSFLSGNGLTEGQFLELLRRDLARQQIVNAVRAGAAAPSFLAERLLAWQREQRSVRLVELRVADAPEPEAPTDAQLERFHENNADRFSAPEYRQVALGLLNAAILTPQMQVTDAELEEAYAAHRARFETPEKREIQQALFQDEAAARAFAATWRANNEGAAAAAEAAHGIFSDLGEVERSGLPVPELATTAFSLADNAVSDPVQTPFGWHVLRAHITQAAETRSLDQVRDELRTEVASEKAADEALRRTNAVQDGLAGGESVEETSRAHNLQYVAVELDAQGKGRDGRDVALPIPSTARAALLREIFGTERGAAPHLAEGDYGFAAIEVKEVTPAALRPLAEVRDAVLRAYVQDARRRHQEGRAAALIAATRAGKSLEEAAREADIPVEEQGPFPREAGATNPIPREYLGPIFELRMNEVTMIPSPVAFAVVQLTGVTHPAVQPPAAPAEGEEAPADPLATIKRETDTAIAEDIEAQFMAAIRARADVRINQRLLNQLAAE
ncbi:peptidylprolyl isomerase [Rhodovarius crocodyli]|nr:peptidylprolyl isomerase [Rhodovarius crocodyli]